MPLERPHRLHRAQQPLARLLVDLLRLLRLAGLYAQRLAHAREVERCRLVLARIDRRAGAAGLAQRGLDAAQGILRAACVGRLRVERAPRAALLHRGGVLLPAALLEQHLQRVTEAAGGAHQGALLTPSRARSWRTASAREVRVPASCDRNSSSAGSSFTAASSSGLVPAR